MTSTSKSDLPAGTGVGREPNMVDTGESSGIQGSTSAPSLPVDEQSSGTTGAATPVAPEPKAESGKSGKSSKSSKRARARAGTQPNNVRKLRQEAMMSKAELARRAGVSPLTIDRVEAGCPCRMDTKRKILEALGLDPSARAKVWPDIDQ